MGNISQRSWVVAVDNLRTNWKAKSRSLQSWENEIFSHIELLPTYADSSLLPIFKDADPGGAEGHFPQLCGKPCKTPLWIQKCPFCIAILLPKFSTQDKTQNDICHQGFLWGWFSALFSCFHWLCIFRGQTLLLSDVSIVLEVPFLTQPTSSISLSFLRPCKYGCYQSLRKAQFPRELKPMSKSSNRLYTHFLLAWVATKHLRFALLKRVCYFNALLESTVCLCWQPDVKKSNFQFGNTTEQRDLSVVTDTSSMKGSQVCYVMLRLSSIIFITTLMTIIITTILLTNVIAI